jgi:hypothetical protein
MQPTTGISSWSPASKHVKLPLPLNAMTPFKGNITLTVQFVIQRKLNLQLARFVKQHETKASFSVIKRATSHSATTRPAVHVPQLFTISRTTKNSFVLNSVTSNNITSYIYWTVHHLDS